MASIGSSNGYSVSSASNGLSGLVSGMDTQSMVEKMLSGTQKKIDNKNGLKQQLLWKQESYRDVISSIQSLKNNFFNLAKMDSNISSSTFYHSLKTVVSGASESIKVTPGSGASAGDVTISKIDQLATGTSVKSGSKVAGQVIGVISEAKYDADFATKKPTIQVSVDGVVKDITLSGEGTGTFEENITENLNKELKKFGNAVEAKLDSATGKVSILDVGSTKTREIQVLGDQKALDVLGMKNGMSNKMNLNVKLENTNFATHLQGQSFKFSINGVDFSFDVNDTLDTVRTKINDSNAGVKISYSSSEDKFTLTSTTTGQGVKMDVKQTQGNLLTSLFGYDGSGIVDSKPIVTQGVSTTINAEDDIWKKMDEGKLDYGVFSMVVNGQLVNVQLPRRFTDGDITKPEYYKDKEDVVKTLNDVLKNGFGTSSNGTPKIQLKLSGDGSQIDLQTTDDIRVSFNESTITGLTQAFGFTKDQNNLADADTTTLWAIGITGSGTLNIGGETIRFSETDTIKSLMNKINNTPWGSPSVKATFEDGSLLITKLTSTPISISGGTDEAGNQLMNRLFGSDSIELGAPGADRPAEKDGVNAKFTITGSDGSSTDMEKSTNIFQLDGLNIELLKTSTSEIKITNTKNTDQIYDNLIKFAEEYNKMVAKLDTLLKEKDTTREYKPLTDAEKKEMTEKEIELWEKSAKGGLLKGDSTINGFLTEMRSVLYSKPQDAPFALFDVGFSTVDFNSDNFAKGGQISLDEAARNKLRENIDKDPEGFYKLFASEGEMVDGKLVNIGIGVQMDKIIDKYTKSSITDPGLLVQQAGIKDTFSEGSSSIDKKIKDIDDIITNLKRQYKMESNRYWRQFNSMEQMIANMNSQSSWLAQQFS